MTQCLVVTLYQFTALPDPQRVLEELRSQAAPTDIRGLIVVSPEGLNGTIAGPQGQVRALVRGLKAMGFDKLSPTETWSETQPFVSLKIQLRQEAVTLDRPELKPYEATGVHVSATKWNTLLRDPEVLIIDARNRYESAIGGFPQARKPDTDTFRTFPDWFERSEETRTHAGAIAMYCTGGIRCEKASALLLAQGFGPVYQLEGGILKYLKEVGPEDNQWFGECYVFDQRVSLNRDLEQGAYGRCPACRHPIDDGDRARAEYEAGVSCPYCVHLDTPTRRARFMERTRQMTLAAQRGESHRLINTGFERKRERRKRASAPGSPPEKRLG